MHVQMHVSNCLMPSELHRRFQCAVLRSHQNEWQASIFFALPRGVNHIVTMDVLGCLLSIVFKFFHCGHSSVVFQGSGKAKENYI